MDFWSKFHSAETVKSKICILMVAKNEKKLPDEAIHIYRFDWITWLENAQYSIDCFSQCTKIHIIIVWFYKRFRHKWGLFIVYFLFVTRISIHKKEQKKRVFNDGFYFNRNGGRSKWAFQSIAILSSIS